MEQPSEGFQPKKIEATPQTEAPVRNRKNPTTEYESYAGVGQKDDPEDKPLVLLETPLIVSELQLEMFFDEDVDGMKKKIGVIDAMIQYEIGEQGWKENVKSYKDALDILKRKTGLTGNETPLTTVNKLFSVLHIVLEDKILQDKIGIDLIQRIKW